MARFPRRHHASGIETLEAHYAVRNSRFPVLRRVLCWLRSLRPRDYEDKISEEERAFSRPRSGEYTMQGLEMSESATPAADDIEDPEAAMREVAKTVEALVAAPSRRLAYSVTTGEELEHVNTPWKDHPISGLHEAW